MIGYLGANQIGLEHIEALHALGYVPLRVVKGGKET